MPVLESSIENRVNEKAKEWGIICQKVKFVEAGFPDRLYILPNGLHVWIEFKRPGEKPDQLQLYRMELLRIRNVIAGWTNEYAIAIGVLKALLGAQGIYEKGGSAFAQPVIGWPIPRPRLGQDCNLSSYLQDLEVAGLCEESVDSSTVEAALQSVARRDREVE
jgi:hypothetical protein